jgi:hypothetical protein
MTPTGNEENPGFPESGNFEKICAIMGKSGFLQP